MSVHAFTNFCSVSIYPFFVIYIPEDGHKSGRNMWQEYYIYNIILDTFIHLGAFVGLVTIYN
jgi:hypothetical protein